MSLAEWLNNAVDLAQMIRKTLVIIFGIQRHDGEVIAFFDSGALFTVEDKDYGILSDPPGHRSLPLPT